MNGLISNEEYALLSLAEFEKRRSANLALRCKKSGKIIDTQLDNVKFSISWAFCTRWFAFLSLKKPQNKGGQRSLCLIAPNDKSLGDVQPSRRDLSSIYMGAIHKLTLARHDEKTTTDSRDQRIVGADPVLSVDSFNPLLC